MFNLFELKVAAAQRHPQFESLRTSPANEGVRRYLNQTFAEMGDPDGSFVHDFQARGFHARLFELACYSYLRSVGLDIERNSRGPDFIVGNGGSEVAIEVTTANAAQHADQDISMLRIQGLDPFDDSGDFEFPSSEEFPKKMRSRLMDKLKRAHQWRPHAIDKTIVLMIAPFFAPGSVAFPDFPLLDVLYPTDPERSATPFFWQPDAHSIGAVAYCNSFTVPKFWRMADPEYLSVECRTIRTGLALFENDPDLRGFRYEIGHKLTPVETWSEGVTLFFNPNATTPLPADFLPASSRFICEGDLVLRHVIGFHPLASRMRAYRRR